MADLKVGDRVRVLIGTPEGEPVDGVVAVLQDKAGKKVGVELDHFVLGGHSLDGKTADKEKVDPETGSSFGKGWWTLEDHLEVL